MSVQGNPDEILTWNAFKAYIKSFAPNYVVGSGGKPGKSCLIRYIARQTRRDQRTICLTPVTSEVSFDAPNEKRFEATWRAFDAPYGVNILQLSERIDPASHLSYTKRDWFVTAGEVAQLIDDIEKAGKVVWEDVVKIKRAIEERNAK